MSLEAVSTKRNRNLPQQLTLDHVSPATRLLEKRLTGYSGGYICKRQKIGQFELKNSLAALPIWHKKIQYANQ